MTASSRIVDAITTDKDKKFERPAQMADAIIDLFSERGDCSPCDLQAKGFSSEEVTALWHFAYSLAAIELKDKAEIDVFVKSTGRRETAAEIRFFGNIDAEDIAKFHCTGRHRAHRQG